jgi:carbonic anhydrase
MSVTDELLRNAKAYATTFEGGGLRSAPARKVAVVACMDARLNIYGLLGLSEGDAHVIRNAGGVVTDEEIRSLAISQHLLGTDEIVLIHHTDCGMASFNSEEFAERLEAAAGTRPNWSAHAFRDIEDDVRTQIGRIQESPFIPHKNVRGFVYDVESGRLNEVTAAPAAAPGGAK